MVNPKSLANLRKPKPGDPTRNPKGTNRWQRAQATLSRFLDEVANPGKDGCETRWHRILFAAYTSALVPGPRGAGDRKLLIEMKAGKAKSIVDISNPDGSMSPARADDTAAAAMAALAAQDVETDDDSEEPELSKETEDPPKDGVT